MKALALVGAFSVIVTTDGSFAALIICHPLLAVVNSDRGDPAVLRLPGLGYLATISSGNEPDAFPIMFSPDLVNWTPSGHVFPKGAWPHWAKSNMWVAEIHKVDEDRYIGNK